MASTKNTSYTLPYPNPRNADERKMNFLSSSVGIVGAVWDMRPTTWWIPRGLEWSNDPKNPVPAYRSPFFGAAKEWETDGQGWTHVTHHRKTKNYRKRRELAQMEMDDYEGVVEE